MATIELAHPEAAASARPRNSDQVKKERSEVPRGRRPSDQGHRLNVLFSEELNTKLENVRKKTHAQTLAEVFRTALIVYTHLFNSHENGDEIVIRSKDGKEKVLQIFI